MSSNATPRRTRLYRGFVALAATALAAVGIGFALNAGATQANFTDDAPVTVHADAGYLDLTATGTVSFSKLVPGHAQSSTVTFNNDGNVGGALTMGLPVSVTNWSLPSGQNPNLAQVMVRVPGSANLNTAMPLTSAPTTVQLGNLAAGGTKNVTVVVEIVSAGDTADNKFQGASVDATVTGRVRTS